jgi:molybdenum cofactor cytidylyltransferase
MAAERSVRHAAIVLAAGASRRLGVSKQRLRYRGESLLRRATRMALATDPSECVVVLGADADANAAQIADLPLRPIHCSEWRQGMGASLRCGLAALDTRCAGALIVVCDQPALTAEHLLALRDAWRGAPLRAAASWYAGVLGVPALLPRAWFVDLADFTGDRGARDLLRARPSQVIAVDSPALEHDVDRPDDLDEHLERTR